MKIIMHPETKHGSKSAGTDSVIKKTLAEILAKPINYLYGESPDEGWLPA